MMTNATQIPKYVLIFEKYFFSVLFPRQQTNIKS